MKYLVLEISSKLDKDTLNELKKIKHNKVNFKSLEYRTLFNGSNLLLKLKRSVISLNNEELLKVKQLVKNVIQNINIDDIKLHIVDYEDIKDILKQSVNRTVKAKTSKQKGKRLENTVAELFQKKLNLPKGSVHRAQSSGTFIYDIGDIRFNIPIPIVIECKNNEGWNYKHLFNNELPSIFKKWINQIDKEVKKAKDLYPDIFKEENTIWMLIFTKNNEPIYVLISENNLNKIQIDNNNIKLPKDFLNKVSYIKNSGYYIFLLETFLNYLSVDT